jgi:hypothetical protein
LARYLAFGSNRAGAAVELADRSALVPDFTSKGLVDAYSPVAELVEEMGAITFSARPWWRVIMDWELTTSRKAESCFILYLVFDTPATSLKASRTYAHWVLERPEEELTLCWEWLRRTNRCVTSFP